VPAIWEDKAKSFMREAAILAGLVKTDDPENLLLVLEPEAASRFCQFRFEASTDSFKMPPGTQYMIVDAGGGTVDITAHRILSDGNLAELIPASGGNWGGNEVNKLFESSLEDLFGKDFILALKQKLPRDRFTIL
jgi:molecular chaperone DnaK (HSP70)